MARSIEESLNIIAARLQTAVSPSTGGFLADRRMLQTIEHAINTGWGTRKRRLIQAQSKAEEAERIDARYNDLVRAHDAMAANPTRWKSTTDYFKWEKGVKTARAAKANADYNWWYDNQSEKDQFIHDATKKYGSRSRAEQAWSKRERDTVLKGLPSFFKDSKLSTKNLQRISKYFNMVRGVPGAGIFGKMAANPITAGIAGTMAVYSTIRSVLSSMDKANAGAIGWENAWNVYGKPSNRFFKAAMAAGINDPGKISELWGKLNYEWGDANMGLAAIGQMSMAPGKHKTFLAKGMGVDPALFAIADMMSGRIGVNDVRKTHANVEMAKLTEMMMQLSGSDKSDIVLGWLTQKMGFHSFVGRDGDALDFSEFQKVIDSANNAANSSDKFDSEGTSVRGGSSSRTTNTSWNVNIEHLETPDVGGFVDQLKERADNSESINEMVIDDNDSREVR